MLSAWSSKERGGTLFLVSLFILFVLGAFFRVRHFLTARSLWLDEAMLALDVLELSFWELTKQPLPYHQGAPIGFLFVTKLATLLWGDSEYVFRLYSFAAGLIALVLIGTLAKAYLGRIGALFSVGLFASGYYFIYYAAENKQYGGDIAVVLILFFLLMRLLESGFSTRKALFFAVVNNLILWFSHPAVFTVAAVGVVLAVHYLREGDQRGFYFALGSLVSYGVNALLVYCFHLHPISSSDVLLSFWEVAFMPFPPSLAWAQGNWVSVLKNPLGIEQYYLLYFFFFLSGIVFLWQKKWQFALVLSLILFFVFSAGALQQYPLAERMMLFAAPVYILLFGAGLEGIYQIVRKGWERYASSRNMGGSKTFTTCLSIGFVLLAVFLAYPSFERAIERFRDPYYREHIRPSLTYLRDHLREDDLIYVYRFAEPAFRFYLPKYGFEEINYVVGGDYEENPKGYLTEIDDLHLEGRVWFLFTHLYEVASINEETFITSYLDELGEQRHLFRAPGTSVSLYLYKFP